MGPIRREQICRAAAKVISEQGFAGTTMRLVAEEAGVSTGMLNHYYTNRMDMLEETLLFVSMRQQERESAAMEALEPGERRLRALVRSVMPTNRDTIEAWRVWIAAHGASVRLPQLRRLMATRNQLWFELLARGLEGVVPANHREKIPYVWQFDALMNGLVIQAITSEADMSFDDIERVLIATALEHAAAVSNGKVSRSRVTKARASR